MNRSFRVLSGTLLALAMVTASCSAPHRGQAARVARPSGPGPVPGLYVAIGASETRGEGTDNPLRQAWTQDFFRTLPSGYGFVNLGVSGATTETALASELPTAQSLQPTLVTVWLNVDDLLGEVPVDRYEQELGDLLHGLKSTGATVLVANTPALEQLPAYLACLDPKTHPGTCSPVVPHPVPGPAVVQAAISAYNLAIARVATANGAVLVDLHGALTDLVAGQAPGEVEASLVSADGFHPNAAGHQAVADRFASALAKLKAAASTGTVKAGGG